MDSLRNNDTITGTHPSEGHPESPAAPPTHCARGCGFFCSEANNGLCSKCFNDYLKEKIAESEAIFIPADLHKKKSEEIFISVDPVDIPMISTNIDELSDSMKSCGSVDETKNDIVSASIPVVKNRCRSCNKKVGLLGFSCRCGGTFCGLHRYPEAHTCRIDFKTAGKNRIAKENPVCVADKIESRV